MLDSQDAIRRLPLLAAMLMALALLGANPGEAHADAAQATVVSPSGEERPLSLDALAGSENVVERTYALRSGSGESSQTVSGFSLAAILAAAGADPFGFSYLEVQRPAGGSVLLSRHQALDPGAFPEGPPVVYATASGTGFLRPSSGAEDFNATDSFEAPQGVRLVMRKDSPLRVRAKASTLRTRPGQAVEFSAIVERAGAGERLTYSWYFDDGHSAAGAETSHSFAKRGSYDVVIGVTTLGDDVGASDVVTIQVGAPLGGPDRKGGGHNRHEDAPDHGAASGPSTGAPAGGAGATGTATAPIPVPAPAPIPSEPAPEVAPTPQPTASAPLGEQVSGLLLSNSTASAPSPEPEQQAAARPGSLDGDGGSGGGLPDAAWGLLATAGLLGTGALIEVGGLSGLLARRRWMAP